MRQTAGILALLGLLVPLSLHAQSAPSDWDVAARHGPARNVEFDVDEGTWMSLDVSPDGGQIVFDLLGDIYTMPGEAARPA